MDAPVGVALLTPSWHDQLSPLAAPLASHSCATYAAHTDSIEPQHEGNVNAAAPYVFISYASADRERVLPIVDRLEAAGVKTWIDREGIHGGANYALEITEALKSSAAILLMCSEASLTSRNVKQEIALGWKYDRPYVPLLLEPVTIPGDVEYWLEAAQWISLHDQQEASWFAKLQLSLHTFGIEVQWPDRDAPTPHGRERPPLVGREREQAMLKEHLDRMLAGKGGTVLVGGEAGIGKTTLVEDLGIQAEERGAIVLWGHAYDLSVTPPYGPWLEIFRQYLSVADASLPPVSPFVGNAEELARIGSRDVIFAAMTEYFVALAAQRPALLVLDDLHWADQVSLDFFRVLARQVLEHRLLIVATYRSDELTRRHPLNTLLPLLVREAGADRVDVRPFDQIGHRALIESRYELTGPDEARLERYLEERAEGNPLYAGELLRTLEDEGVLTWEDERWVLGDLEQASVPPLLRQVIEGRVARLDEASQRLLDVAAVIGQTVTLSIWARVGEVDENNLLELAERAEEARMLEGTGNGDGVRFQHALIREALYESLPSLRRRRLHRQVAEVLVENPGADSDAVAYHFERAGDERTVSWLMAAGDRADRLGAYVTAADRHERALTLVRAGDDAVRGWLLLRLGVLLRHSDLERALDYLEAAQPVVRASGDVALAAYWHATRGLVRCLAGRGRAGLPDLHTGVAAIRALPDEDRAALALSACVTIALETDGESTYADWLVMLGNLEEGRIACEALLAERAATGKEPTRPAGDVNFGLALAYAGLGKPDAAAEAAARARDAYRQIGNHGMAIMASRILMRFILLPYYADREAEQRAALSAAHDEMARDLERLVDGGAVPPEVADLMARLLDSDSAAVEGRWAETRQAAMAVLELGLSSLFLRQVGASHAVIARGQGDLDVAWRLVRLALPDGPEYQPGNQAIHIALPLQQLAPALALDARDLPSAHAWLEAHDRWLAWSGAVLGRAEGALLWGKYHHANGDVSQARALAERALAHATDPRQPLALIAIHRFLGQLDLKEQHFSAADEYLNESLRLSEACAAPFERALTLLEIAKLRAAQLKPDEARALLAEVRAICEPLGATPTLECVAALEEQLIGTA